MNEKAPGIYAAEDEMRMHLEGIRRGLENFLSHPRITPDDAALLMCGINPARKQGIKSSDKTTEEDYEALRAMFQAEQAVNGGHKTLAEWLALAEKKRHKHHPVVREYLEFASNLAGYEGLTTDAHAATPAPVVDRASTGTKPAPQPVPVTPPADPDEESAPRVAPDTAPLPAHRKVRTGWKDGPAFDYVAKQFAQHGPFQAKALIARLKKNTDQESPFEVRGGVLTIRATGQALQDKTIENAMVDIRGRAKGHGALQG